MKLRFFRIKASDEAFRLQLQRGFNKVVSHLSPQWSYRRLQLFVLRSGTHSFGNQPLNASLKLPLIFMCGNVCWSRNIRATISTIHIRFKRIMIIRIIKALTWQRFVLIKTRVPRKSWSTERMKTLHFSQTSKSDMREFRIWTFDLWAWGSVTQLYQDPHTGSRRGRVVSVVLCQEKCFYSESFWTKPGVVMNKSCITLTLFLSSSCSVFARLKCSHTPVLKMGNLKVSICLIKAGIFPQTQTLDSLTCWHPAADQLGLNHYNYNLLHRETCRHGNDSNLTALPGDSGRAGKGQRSWSQVWVTECLSGLLEMIRSFSETDLNQTYQDF